jgi:hypothetical protein
VQEACIKTRTANIMLQILSKGLHGWFNHEPALSPDA